MYIVNAEQMRAADRHAIEVLKIPSLQLMENAATQIVRVLVSRYPEPRKVAVVCGKGNNGGDGMAVARLLKEKGWSPKVLLIGSAKDLKEDPSLNWRRAIESGVVCEENVGGAQLGSYLSDADLIVDAMFGTGLTKPLAGEFAEAIKAMQDAGKEIWAIDVPSGLSSDTGDLIGPAVRATATVALACTKYCHAIPPACLYCGEIFVVNIDIPVTVGDRWILSREVRNMFPGRPQDSHKGTFGHLLVVGGSTGKSGAPYMAGKAGLRSGAGLVTVASPDRVQPLVAGYGPEIMTEPAGGNPDFFSPDAIDRIVSLAENKTAVALGPGIGTHPETETFVKTVVPLLRCSLILDADGLNLIAKNPAVLLQRKPFTTILTPHAGEMARLMKTDTATVRKERLQLVRELALQTRSIVILKGYRTLIAEGTENVWVNPSGCQALASAGTGDVLTGVIAGLAAQRIPLLHAAMAGVFAHGLAGNLFEKLYPQQAMNAMDILSFWNQAIEKIRSQKDLEGEYFGIHFPF